MALEWNFEKDFFGTMKTMVFIGGKPRTVYANLYTGNAFYIGLFEWEDGEKKNHQLVNFAADKQHMTYCVKEDCAPKKVQLLPCKRSKEMVTELMKKMDDETEIYIGRDVCKRVYEAKDFKVDGDSNDDR